MSNPRANSEPQDVCNVPCFDQAKVRNIRRDLVREAAHLPALADVYKLLGNATRLKVLLALEKTELCVCDVAHVLGLSIAATSHQLKLLHNGGWLRKRDDGKMVYYRLQSAGLIKAVKGDLKLLAARSG